jgi:hypothetical protein
MKIVSINANDVKKMFKVCGACLDTDGVRARIGQSRSEVGTLSPQRKKK